MNAPLWLFGIELVFLLGVGSAAWLLGLWRGRRRRAAELEALLNILETAAPKRCERYCQWLRTHCDIDEEQALLTANAWLEAERRFWRHFITWRLEPDPDGTARLPAHLHRYLDDRLEALGLLLQPSEPVVEPEEAAEDTGAETAETVGAEEAAAPADTPETGEESGAPASETESDPGTIPDASADDAAERDTSPPEDDDEDILILSDRNGETGKTDDQETAAASETGAQSSASPQ